MTSDEAAAAVSETLARLGLTLTELGTISETIARRGSPPPLPSRALPHVSLSESAGPGPDEPDPDLLVLGEIGRGGMGVVRLAVQRSLDREVAVKTARSSDEAVGRALVREARIMGALEHPNLVPIHALGVDASGTPLLVMKRIEGTSWRELLRSDEHPAWPPLLLGHGDRIRGHVDILAQVSRALALAHDRGIIHRDLKPANVMIGRFGEVYLLDWGAAVRLSERESEPFTIVGTPGYLAPEMARADPRLIDARTDVYLLGATLYEVLTGRVPHEAPTITAALVSALVGAPPPIPASAPADLVALVRAAMAVEPAARPTTAEAFREGLARYLVSREADLVVDAARAALGRAEVKMASEGAASAGGYRALIEARFGFSSAARSRPADEAIRAQLDLTGVRLVERELALRSPGSARALLAELARPPGQLVQQVEALEQEIARERTAADELARSRRNADSSPMVATISVMLGVIAVPTGALGLWMAWQAAHSSDGFPVFEGVALDLSAMTLFVLGLFLGRKTLFATVASRRNTTYLGIGLSGMAAADLLTLALGRNTSESAAHAFTAGMVLMALVAATEIREFWAGVGVHAAAVCAIVLYPRFAPVVAVAALSLDVVVFVWAFRRAASRSRGPGT